jgi:hypothetical protein
MLTGRHPQPSLRHPPRDGSSPDAPASPDALPELSVPGPAVTVSFSGPVPRVGSGLPSLLITTLILPIFGGVFLDLKHQACSLVRLILRLGVLVLGAARLSRFHELSFPVLNRLDRTPFPAWMAPQRFVAAPPQRPAMGRFFIFA